MDCRTPATYTIQYKATAAKLKRNSEDNRVNAPSPSSMAKADSRPNGLSHPSRTSSFDSISSDTAPIIMRARSVRLSRTHFDVAIAVFAIFCMAGVVFGVSSLYPILYQQGLFHSSCSAVESFGQHHCSEDAQRRTKCCPSQFVMFSLISSSAFFAIDVSAAFWSALISRDQPR